MDDNFFGSNSYQEDKSKSKKRIKRDYLSDLESSSKKKQKKNKIKPFMIHILIVVIILILFSVYLLSDFSFDFGGSNTITQKSITIIGDLISFNETYNGNLKLTSSEFKLQTPNTIFKEESSKDFFISNFSGIIYLFNNSIFLKGKSSQIIFGKNSVDLKDSNFILESRIKTTTTLIFKNISLNLVKGRILLDDTLNYEFDNSSILLSNFNTTFTYDSIFAFRGYADNFNLISNSDNLKISYQK